MSEQEASTALQEKAERDARDWCLAWNKGEDHHIAAVQAATVIRDLLSAISTLQEEHAELLTALKKIAAVPLSPSERLPVVKDIQAIARAAIALAEGRR